MALAEPHEGRTGTTTCRMYEQKYPEVDDVVMVQARFHVAARLFVFILHATSFILSDPRYAFSHLCLRWCRLCSVELPCLQRARKNTSHNITATS